MCDSYYIILYVSLVKKNTFKKYKLSNYIMIIEIRILLSIFLKLNLYLLVCNNLISKIELLFAIC